MWPLYTNRIGRLRTGTVSGMMVMSSNAVMFEAMLTLVATAEATAAAVAEATAVAVDVAESPFDNLSTISSMITVATDLPTVVDGDPKVVNAPLNLEV